MEEPKEEEPTDEYEVAYNIVSCQELVLSMNEAKRRCFPTTGSFFNEYLGVHEVNRSDGKNGIRDSYLISAADFIWQNMNTFDHDTIGDAIDNLNYDGRIHLDKVFHLICQLIRSAYSDKHSIDVLETLDKDVVRAATLLFKILAKYHSQKKPHPLKSISQEEFHKIEEYVQMIIEEKDYLNPNRGKNISYFTQSKGTSKYGIEYTDNSTLPTPSILNLQLQNRPKSVKSSEASLNIPHMLKENNSKFPIYKSNGLNLNSKRSDSAHEKSVGARLKKSSFNILHGDKTRNSKELRNIQLNIDEITQLLPFLTSTYKMNTAQHSLEDTGTDSQINHATILEGDGVQSPFSRASVARYINKINLKTKAEGSLGMPVLVEDSAEYNMSCQFTSGIRKIQKGKVPLTNPGGDNFVQIEPHDRDLSQYVKMGSLSQYMPPKQKCLKEKLPQDFLNKSKNYIYDSDILSHNPNGNSKNEESFVAQNHTGRSRSSLALLSQPKSPATIQQNDSLAKVSERQTKSLKSVPKFESSDNSSMYMDVLEWSENSSESLEKNFKLVSCSSIDLDEAFFRSSNATGSHTSVISDISDILSVTFSSDRFKIEKSVASEKSESFSHLGYVKGLHNENCLIGLAILVLLGSVIPFRKLQNAVISKVKTNIMDVNTSDII